MDAARRFKRYPRIALDNNWQGRVEVRLTVAPDGALAALDVKTSAGHEVLDRQALDMIRRAKSLTPVPSALRGREVTVDVPVIFSLNEPDA
jgi:protein TonB